MEYISYPTATTSPAMRREIQSSELSNLALAAKFNINVKTVVKWRKRPKGEIADRKPPGARSKLRVEQEQIICEARKQTRLGLDDLLVALQDCIPNLNRNILHRCLKRHGLNRLEAPKKKKKSGKFAAYPLGYIHVDIVEVRIKDGKKCYIYTAIERLSKTVHIEAYDRKTIENACDFLRKVAARFPFIIHRVLTDNGSQFTYALLAEHLQPKNKTHPFDDLCNSLKIKHKLTKFRHPWTNGQNERFNRTLQDATTKTYYYQNITELQNHLSSYLNAIHYAKPLRALKHLTPHQFLLDQFKNSPTLFYRQPTHLNALSSTGPYT